MHFLNMNSLKLKKRYHKEESLVICVGSGKVQYFVLEVIEIITLVWVIVMLIFGSERSTNNCNVENAVVR